MVWNLRGAKNSLLMESRWPIHGKVTSRNIERSSGWLRTDVAGHRVSEMAMGYMT